jgi:hypothetical protein
VSERSKVTPRRIAKGVRPSTFMTRDTVYTHVTPGTSMKETTQMRLEDMADSIPQGSRSAYETWFSPSGRSPR